MFLKGKRHRNVYALTPGSYINDVTTHIPTQAVLSKMETETISQKRIRIVFDSSRIRDMFERKGFRQFKRVIWTFEWSLCNIFFEGICFNTKDDQFYFFNVFKSFFTIYVIERGWLLCWASGWSKKKKLSCMRTQFQRLLLPGPSLPRPT